MSALDYTFFMERARSEVTGTKIEQEETEITEGFDSSRFSQLSAV